VKVERDRGFLFTDYEVSGQADLSRLTAGVAADPEVVAQLTGQRVDVAQIEQRLSQQIKDAFHLRVRLVLPGGNAKEIAPRPGKKVSLAASASQLDVTRAVLLAAAVALALLGIVLFVRGELRGRRSARRGGRGARGV
jgi:hypothetical protein